jgi:hypothetical protein
VSKEEEEEEEEEEVQCWAVIRNGKEPEVIIPAPGCARVCA